MTFHVWHNCWQVLFWRWISNWLDLHGTNDFLCNQKALLIYKGICDYLSRLLLCSDYSSTDIYASYSLSGLWSCLPAHLEICLALKQAVRLLCDLDRELHKTKAWKLIDFFPLVNDALLSCFGNSGAFRSMLVLHCSKYKFYVLLLISHFESISSIHCFKWLETTASVVWLRLDLILIDKQQWLRLQRVWIALSLFNRRHLSILIF